MAYPEVDPLWATDANFSSGPESGNPTKTDVGAATRQQGFVPGQRFKAQRVNFELRLLGGWIVNYLKDLHNQVEFLSKTYAWTGSHTGSANYDTSGTMESAGFKIDHASATYDFKSARTNEVLVLPLTSGSNGVDTSADNWLIQNSSGHLESQGAGTRVYDFSLPSGWSLQQMSAWVTAPSGTIGLTIVDRTCNIGTGSTTEGGLFTASDSNSGTTIELLAASATPLVTNSATTHYRVYLSSDAANQLVHCLFAVVTNVGPR